MINDTIASGVMLFISAMFGYTRHFLFEPKMTHYPPAPKWLLIVYFGFATVLFYLSMSFLHAAAFGPWTTPPQAGSRFTMISLALLIYKGSMLYNVLRQRYPAEVWQRINRITSVVVCSKK